MPFQDAPNLYTLPPALLPHTCPAAVASQRTKGRGDVGEGIATVKEGTTWSLLVWRRRRGRG
jgi:hypothetical protein